jgi:hypothetical protein
MSVAHQQRVDEIRRSWRAEFERGRQMSLGGPDWRRYTRPVEAPDGALYDKLQMYWPTIDGRMTRDKGLRTFHTPQIFTHSIESQLYRDGLRVNADEWLKNGIGDVYREAFLAMGMWPENERIFTFWDILLQGTTAAYGTTYDGQELFGEHPGFTIHGVPTTYENNFTLALTKDNFIAVREAMRRFRSMNRTRAPNMMGTPHVIAGPKYEATLKSLFGLLRAPGEAGADNVLFNEATYGISPFCVGDDADTWFMYMTSPFESERPVAIYEPYNVQLLEVTDPTSKAYFDLHAYEFGINDRFGMVPNAWECIARSKP